MPETEVTAGEVRATHLAATPLLDHGDARVRSLTATLTAEEPQALLRAAHASIRERVRPVYTVDELQPASRTIEKGRGSCSQRIGCLEAAARARGIGTRVRELWIDGRFWHPRFGRWLWPFLPRRILLAWPQFHVGGAWLVRRRGIKYGRLCLLGDF